jgi:hypothetical protein
MQVAVGIVLGIVSSLVGYSVEAKQIVEFALITCAVLSIWGFFRAAYNNGWWPSWWCGFFAATFLLFAHQCLFQLWGAQFSH